MKTILFAAISLSLLIGCSSEGTVVNGADSKINQENPFLTDDDNIVSELETIFKTSSDTILSVNEKAGLIYMREEEKLARDVYKKMYEKYHIRIFYNINRSEQQHTDAVKRLLNYYNVPDPAQNTPPGIFINTELQNLYGELINRGNVSLLDAYKVGRDVETKDIEDLEVQLTNVVAHENIRRVYQNLKSASVRHLQAFNWHIQP